MPLTRFLAPGVRANSQKVCFYRVARLRVWRPLACHEIESALSRVILNFFAKNVRSRQQKADFQYIG